jgi:hypothetical protein
MLLPKFLCFKCLTIILYAFVRGRALQIMQMEHHLGQGVIWCPPGTAHQGDAISFQQMAMYGP